MPANQRILLLTIGTRGDVQPFVALGKALVARGHTVSVCTTSRFERFVTSQGLQYHYLNDELLALMDTAMAGAATTAQSTWGLIKTFARLKKRSAAIQAQTLVESWEAAKTFQPDIIIAHPKAMAASHIAEKLAIPSCLVLLVPMLQPTAAFPNPVLPAWRLGGTYNKLSHQLTNWALFRYAKAPLNTFRTETLKLPRIAKGNEVLYGRAPQTLPNLCAISPSLLPRPADWPDAIQMTGFWFLSATNSTPPSESLQQFLQAGEPPLYIGLGSMPVLREPTLLKTIQQALTHNSQRAIIQVPNTQDFAAIPQPATVLLTQEALPHGWLFPQMQGIWHHGGIGTTAAALQAGQPSFITPVIADQPFWGRHIHQRALGPAPVPFKRLTKAKLITAFQQLSHYQANAEKLAQAIAEEDGIATAIRLLAL